MSFETEVLLNKRSIEMKDRRLHSFDQLNNMMAIDLNLQRMQQEYMNRVNNKKNDKRY